MARREACDEKVKVKKTANGILLRCTVSRRNIFDDLIIVLLVVGGPDIRGTR